VYECPLTEGIERGDLSPFRYFGIADDVDYAPIPWRGGRFDPAALTEAVETQERAQHALDTWRDKGGGRTLAFCVSVSHADFTAEFFRRHGIAAAAVHSGPTRPRPSMTSARCHARSASRRVAKLPADCRRPRRSR
jgi:superfamily II DNA or RNA helicase